MNSIINYFKTHALALTFASMLFSIVCYSMIFGWIVSIGFTLCLLIHEMGHFYAAKQQKIQTTVPVFLPFLGAFISFKQNPYSASQEAYIGIAGPIAGTVSALVSFACYQVTGYMPLLEITFLAAFLNLFNLIPLSPMDGGRTVTAITPWLWLVGAVFIIATVIILKSVVAILIGLVGFQQIRTVLFGSAYKTGELSAYYKTTWATKLRYSAIYILLMVVLFGLMNVSASYINAQSISMFK